MKNIINILHEIESTSSRNSKEEILKQHKDNELLKRVFEMSLNPYKVFNVGSKTFVKKISGNFTTEFETVFELMEYLMKHNASDETKLKVNKFILFQPEEDREWYKRMLLKDLKIGATSGTINKVFGKGFVPEFSVALAEPFERLFKHVAIEPKLDGVRCTAIKENGVTNLFTRNGKAIEGFSAIINQINNIPEDNFVLDGEIMGKDYKDTMEKLFKKTGEKDGDYHIFDLLPLDEFRNSESKDNYYYRRGNLENLSSCFGDNLKLVKIYEMIENPSDQDILKWVSVAESEGYEGTMVKNCESTYKCKRSYDIQKCKTFHSEEFIIIGFEEGEGKYSGTLGKVIVDADGLPVGVGSGWTDAERHEIWNDQDKYLGLQLEVQYQEKIKKTGSLRFPTVKSIRYDK